MKKIKILIFFVLVSNTLLAQKIENLKPRDTIYILFDVNQKYDDLYVSNPKNKLNKTYMYVFPDGKTLSFLAYVGGQFKKENFCKKNSFLEKEKSKIITIEDIHKTGFHKTVYEFETKKIVVFIVDKENFKRKKIYVKKAFLQNTVPSII